LPCHAGRSTPSFFDRHPAENRNPVCPLIMLLPLNRTGGFAGDVVAKVFDTVDFVGDAVGDAFSRRTEVKKVSDGRFPFPPVSSSPHGSI
jgi:hypothetical protein